MYAVVIVLGIHLECVDDSGIPYAMAWIGSLLLRKAIRQVLRKGKWMATCVWPCEGNKE